MNDRVIEQPHSSWTALALTIAVNVLFAAGLFSHAFLYNFYLEALGHGPRVFGNAAAALTLGGLIALIPAGVATDRWGARRAYLVSAILLGAGLAGSALVTHRSAVYAFALVAGFGTATWRVAMAPLLVQNAPAVLRARAFSWNIAALVGSGAGWTFILGAAPAWIARQSGWSTLAGMRMALLIGAAGSILGLGLLLMTSSKRATTVMPPAPNRQAGLRVPALFMGLALIIGIWMSASGLVLPFFNLFFHRVHGMPVSQVGALFAAAQLVSAFALVVTGELSNRFGAARTLTWLAVAFAPLLWGLAVSSVLGVAMVLYVLQNIVPPATNALIDQLLMTHAPLEKRGAISSWRNAATEGSGFVGASAGGFLLERWSYRGLIGTAGTIALLGALLVIGAFRRLQHWAGAHASAPAESAAQQSEEPLTIDTADRTT